MDRLFTTIVNSWFLAVGHLFFLGLHLERRREDA